MSDLSKLGKDEAFSKSALRPARQSQSGRAEHHGGENGTPSPAIQERHTDIHWEVGFLSPQCGPLVSKETLFF